MADVFISYASADREAAGRLAATLEAHGWSVWWDRDIQPGQRFDRVIESELEQARCVVVLWSPSSVVSEWVRNEAASAAERDVLVPALIESARLPLQFRHRQAADLTRWRADPDAPEFQTLVVAITAVIDPNRTPGPRPLTVRRSNRSRAVLAMSTALALVASAVGWGVWNLRREPASTKSVEQPTATTPAADLNGRWDIERSEDRLKMYLELKVASGTLVGHEVIGYRNDALDVMAGLKPEAPILDGNVAGNRISFITKRTYKRKPADTTWTTATHRYNGRIDGDRIYFTFSDDVAGEYFELTAVRRPTYKRGELISALAGNGTSNDMQLLPGGRLASASRDNTVTIWNLSTGEGKTLVDWGNQMSSVVALPGDRIAAADIYGRVAAFDTQTGKKLVDFARPTGHIERIVALRDGRVAGGYSDGSIVFWNSMTGTIERTVNYGHWVVRFVAMRDGRLATGDDEGSIQIWNVASGQSDLTVRSGRRSDGAVNALVELDDGRLAFAFGKNKEIIIWNPASKATEGKIAMTAGESAQVIAGLTGARLAVLDTDNVLTIWNVTSGTKEETFEMSQTKWARGPMIQLSADRLAVAVGNGPIEIWKIR